MPMLETFQTGWAEGSFTAPGLLGNTIKHKLFLSYLRSSYA